MKFLIFAVLVATLAVEVIAYLDFLQKSPFDVAAGDLRGRIKQARKDINRLQSDVNNAAKHVKSTDFRLKKQYSVLQVQEKINNKAYGWGIFSKAYKCKQQFENNVKLLNSELEEIIKSNLTSFSESLNTKKSDLTALQNKLSGKGLAAEVDSCRTSEKQCKLTGDYDKDLKNTENFVKENLSNLKSHHLVNDIVATEIGPILPTKIDEKLVKPAEECLQTV